MYVDDHCRHRKEKHTVNLHGLVDEKHRFRIV